MDAARPCVGLAFGLRAGWRGCIVRFRSLIFITMIEQDFERVKNYLNAAASFYGYGRF